MKVEELLRAFNFHDSNIIELSHVGNVVKVTLDICMWKQVGYKEEDDEIKTIILKFKDVSNYMWDAQKKELEIDYDTILEMTYDENNLKMVLYDDSISIVEFKTNFVELVYI